jgi:cysteinyl-tRNA synthetase
MIEMIEKLIKRGYAYESNGSVFYNVEKFKNYGKLSGNTLKNLKTGARIEPHPDKKNPYDFALWLKAGPDHLMQWDSPWGKGYPGWHIECSAMSINNLGKTIDIHTGGEDNIFPHHEDEIAQSEGTTGKKFVNHWIHGRHLLVDGEKMSKSKGNFYVLSDIEKKGFSPLAFRYLCLTAHFQSQLNFTWKSLEASQNALNGLYDFMKYPPASASRHPMSYKTLDVSPEKYENKFKEALENNLDTPKALTVVWEIIKLKGCDYDSKKKTLLKFDKVLGLDLDRIKGERIDIPNDIKKLAEEREKARKRKDWEKADEIREVIKKRGYVIEDMVNGIKITTRKTS